MFLGRMPQRLNHHHFQAAPSTIIVFIVNKTDHSVTLRYNHRQCCDSFLRSVLIDASMALWNQSTQHSTNLIDEYRTKISYNPDPKIIKFHLRMLVLELESR